MAGHHEKSRRGDSGRDSAESSKSVDQAAGSKKDAAVNDDDWGYEPRKGGMAIEAKMGMCIVVILISAFGFLVYRKFDARQRALLQANLQAAEQSLPGSTSPLGGDQFAEFQPGPSNSFAQPGDQSSEATSPSESTFSETSFESSFALQGDSSPSANADALELQPEPSTPEMQPEPSFATLEEPLTAPQDQSDSAFDQTMAIAAADPSQDGFEGREASARDQFLNDLELKGSTTTESTQQPSESPFDSFGSFDDSGTGVKSAQLVPAESSTDQPTGEPSSAPAEPTFEGFPAGFESEPTVSPKTNDSSSEESEFIAFGESNNAPVQDSPQQNDGWASSTTSSAAFGDGNVVKQDTADSSGEDRNFSGDPFAPDVQSFDSKNEPRFAETADSLPTSRAGEEQPEFDSFPGDFESSFAGSSDPQPSTDLVAQEKPFESLPGFDAQRKPSQVDPQLAPSTDSEFAITDRSRPEVNPSVVMHSSSSDGQISVQPAAGELEFGNSDSSPLPAESKAGAEEPSWNDAQFVSRSSQSQDQAPTLKVPGEGQVDQALSDSFNNSIAPDPQGGRSSSSITTVGTGYDSDPVIAISRPVVSQPKGSIQQVSATRTPDGIYTVKEDDTYWTISKHAYGTARFFSSLALYNSNRIKDPRRLRKGMKVVIPDPQVLIERYPELLKDYIPKESKPAGYFLRSDGSPAYRIGERETLSEISQKHLGRASRWIQIYRMNQHVLENPNRLKPGTVIDLPDDATNVRMVP